MADSHFAISNQSDIEQLKENSKNQNTLKETQTWLKVWQHWTTEKEINHKIEQYEHKIKELVDKILQEFYAKI